MEERMIDLPASYLESVTQCIDKRRAHGMKHMFYRVELNKLFTSWCEKAPYVGFYNTPEHKYYDVFYFILDEVYSMSIGGHTLEEWGTITAKRAMPMLEKLVFPYIYEHKLFSPMFLLRKAPEKHDKRYSLENLYTKRHAESVLVREYHCKNGTYKLPANVVELLTGRVNFKGVIDRDIFLKDWFLYCGDKRLFVFKESSNPLFKGKVIARQGWSFNTNAN